MNANQPRNSNLILCYSMIFLGALCIFSTIVAAFLLKEGIIKRVSKPLSVESLGRGFEIDSIKRQIESKEKKIESEKSSTGDVEEQLRKAREDADKKLGKKNAVNTNSSSSFEQRKAERIKKLEDEKAQLTVRKDALTEKERTRAEEKRSWSSRLKEHWLSIRLFIALLTLGSFSYVFMRLTFFGAMPDRNRLSLTGFEIRSVLFLIFAIVLSAFGFFLFAFILTLIY